MYLREICILILFYSLFQVNTDPAPEITANDLDPDRQTFKTVADQRDHSTTAIQSEPSLPPTQAPSNLPPVLGSSSIPSPPPSHPIVPSPPPPPPSVPIPPPAPPAVPAPPPPPPPKGVPPPPPPPVVPAPPPSVPPFFDPVTYKSDLPPPPHVTYTALKYVNVLDYNDLYIRCLMDRSLKCWSFSGIYAGIFFCNVKYIMKTFCFIKASVIIVQKQALSLNFALHG